MKIPGSGEPVDPRERLLRIVLVLVGLVAVALGTIGAVLPVLPTTPFMLVAAACFARASPRLYRWLLRTRWFGPPIRRWRRTRTVTVRTKVTAIALVVVSMGSSAALFVESTFGRIAMAVVAVGVVALLLSLRTGPATPRAAPRDPPAS